MRFSSEAYEKLYPREKETEVIETAVESFTPTIDEVEKADGEEVENGSAGNDNTDGE